MKKIILFALFVLLFSYTVHAENVNRNIAVSDIALAEAEMIDMVNLGLSVNQINDTILQAKQALNRADFADLVNSGATGELVNKAKKTLEDLNYTGFTYEDVLVYTNIVHSRKKEALVLIDSVRALELKIQDAKSQDINIIASEDYLNQAKKAFSQERYQETTDLIFKGNSELDKEKSDLAKLNALVKSSQNFVFKHWLQILIILLVLLILIYICFRINKIMKLKRNLRNLKFEVKSLNKLMKNLQEDRYKKCTISEYVYKIRLKKYKERMDYIERTIPVIEAILRKK